jgi:hypothetical protein
MSAEAIVLAVMNAVRPAGLAVVYALLGAPNARRLLSAYIVAGFAWSATVGAVVVAAVHGVEVGGDATATALVELLGGIAVLGFAVGYIRGRRESGDDSPSPGPRVPARLRNPSLALAAGAGVLTHLPGLFYLLGLNAIASGDPGLVDGVVDVLIFNAIWFSTPITVLVLAIRRREATRALLARVNAWARRHEREAVTAFSVLVGVYFTAKGAANLLD